MWKKLRDLGATVVVLIVLFAMLVLINPRMREQVNQFSQATPAEQWNSSGPVADVALAVVAVTSDFAADNPFMFAFAIVAAVLFVLMLRT